MKRHHITLGASTTADGIVTSASSLMSINGAPIALEGDPVSCPACGSVGVIRCIGPRIPDRYNGNHVALENDLCICNCPRPPRLLANQTIKSQFIEDSNTQWVAPANLAEGKHGAAYDQRFLLLDRLTQVPLARQPYRLKHGAVIVEGMTDEDGYTAPIPTGGTSDTVEWYILGEDPHGK
jgi:uncharacterized Zn-binding protein involved in type VI secretion